MTDTRSLPVLRRVPHHKVSPGSAMRSLVDGSVVLRLLDGTGAIAPSSRSKARDGLPWSNADTTPREVLAEGLTEAEILELLPLGPADAAAWLARRLKSRGVEVGGRALGRDMPIGAVAGYDSNPVELTIWRAGGPQYLTSMTGGMHPDRGGSCFGGFGAGDKWRVYALGVDPDALPRAAIEAAAGGLRREGLVLVGDRVQKVEAPAQVGATIESAAELLRLPLGALLVDSSGDPVIRRRDGTAHWCDLYPYSRCADYTWEGGGSEGDIEDALAWPLRILAFHREEITVENAAALARASEVGRLRSEGLPAFAGPDVPARSVVEVWGKDEVAIRFPSGGWLPEGSGPARVDSDDLWDWDLEAPAIVLAGNLSDDELLEVAAKDGRAAAREWCEARKRRGPAGAPAGAGPLPGQVVEGREVRPGSLAGAPQVSATGVEVKVGDEVAGDRLPPGGVLQHEGSGRFCARRADGRAWWFGPGLDSVDKDGRALVEGQAQWWGGWPTRADRGKVVALGASDADLCDPSWLRRTLGSPAGCAWAIRAEVAGPRLVSPAEAPRGWLLLDSAGGAAWVRLADGTGRLVRHDGTWLGLGGRCWSWPDGGPQPNHKPQPEARLRPLLELPRDGGQTPEAAHAIRAALWRESPPKGALDLAAEALALAAGALGPLARGRVAEYGAAVDVLLAAVLAASVGDRVAAWTPAGLVFGDAATVAAVAALYLAKLVAHGDRCASALDSLAGLPGDRVGALRDLLTGTDRRVEWTCGGLSCAVSRSEWRAGGVLCSPSGSPRPPQVAAGLVDHLLDQAGRRIQAGATRRGEGVRAWVARAELGDLAPSRCGPAVAPPGEATVCAVGPSFGAARSAEGLALAQVARVLRVGRRAGVVRSEWAATCSIAVDGVERHAREAVAALDAAGLLP